MQSLWSATKPAGMARMENYDRTYDRITWKLMCGRAYDRCIRQAQNAVNRKETRERISGVVKVAKTFATYEDLERHMLAELGPNATPGVRDRAIARAARQWRNSRIGA